MSLAVVVFFPRILIASVANYALPAFADSENADWPFAGADLHNTANASKENKLGPDNVGNLAVKWILDTVGNVSATPAVVDGSVYVTDWGTNEAGGYIYKIDATDGSIIWRHQISEFTENPNSVSRNTPAVQGNFVVFGDQASPATVIAIDTQHGNLIWKTIIDDQFLSSVTQSPVIYQDKHNAGKVFVGTASRVEEGWSRTHPGYIRTFRGSINALDLLTGRLLAQTYMSPPPTDPSKEGYTGTSVWGNTAVVDTKRNSLYIGTGDNYSIPATATSLDPDDHVDSVVALDLDTLQIKWAQRFGFGAGHRDTWSIGCPPGQIVGPVPTYCYIPVGYDWDFAGGPNLYTVKGHGKPVDILGAGQKSGWYWALNPDDGTVLWGTPVGPGGTLGGMEWGSATDGSQIYVAIANNGHKTYGPPDGSANTDPYAPEPNGYPLYQLSNTFNGGAWSALDARTGSINWQVPVPGVDSKSGLAALGFSAVTVANGVMYASSTAGDMVALDASSGATLWKYTVEGLPNPAGASYGATNASAPAVVDSVVYWGAGYARFGGFLGRGAEHHLYAFSVPHGRGRD
jgi:polyvinyl alcohol dehydrogenase (cytochrome)